MFHTKSIVTEKLVFPKSNANHSLEQHRATSDLRFYNYTRLHLKSK